MSAFRKRSSSKEQALIRAQEMYELGYSHRDVVGMLVGKYLYDHAQANSISRGARWRADHKGEISDIQKTDAEITKERELGVDSRGYKVDNDGIIEED